MSSVFRFDLLNYWLREAVDINPCQCEAFPMARRLILIPTEKQSQIPEWQSALSLARDERQAIAFLEYDGTGDEISLQSEAQEFMSWVSWLLSLSELRDIYYWGSHHYQRETSTWKLKSSAWKQSAVVDWKPSKLLGMTVFEGTVPYWRMPQFLPQGLNMFSDGHFAREDFIAALHLFLDSLRPGSSELTQLRFIKKWIAFEKLINEHCQADGSLYVFDRPNSTDFLLLMRSLEEIIDTHPSVLSKPGSAKALKRHLMALQRFPIKMLAPKFLNRFTVEYSPKDIDEVVDMRNQVMHYAEEAKTSKNVWELNQVLHGSISTVLCRLLKWDFEKELKVPYAPPSRGELPSYIGLERDSYILNAQGVGRLEPEDASCTVQCNGRVEWNRDSILGQMTSSGQDAIKIHELMRDFKSLRVRLEVENGTLLLEGAKIVHSEGLLNVLYNVKGLRVFRQIGA
jgi:hypothetical protein